MRARTAEIAASLVTAIVVVGFCIVLPLPRAPAGRAAGIALTGSTPYSLDTVDDGTGRIILRWHPQPLVAPAVDDALVFSGWAVDVGLAESASAVVAVVDGDRSFTAPVNVPRPDVATYLHSERYARCGFVLAIPAHGLAPGPHRIAFRFVAADGRGYYRAGDFVDIDVRASR